MRIRVKGKSKVREDISEEREGWFAKYRREKRAQAIKVRENPEGKYKCACGKRFDDLEEMSKHIRQQGNSKEHYFKTK